MISASLFLAKTTLRKEIEEKPELSQCHRADCGRHSETAKRQRIFRLRKFTASTCENMKHVISADRLEMQLLITLESLQAIFARVLLLAVRISFIVHTFIVFHNKMQFL